MTEKTTKQRSRSRSRLHSDGDIMVVDSDAQQRRYSTMSSGSGSGKEVIIRTNMSYRVSNNGNNVYDGRSSSRTIGSSSRRSMRVRQNGKESSNKLKHSALEPLDTYEYNSYTQHKSKNRDAAADHRGNNGGHHNNITNSRRSRSSSSGGGVTMKEIFSTIKLGMSTFSVPRFYAKSNKGSRLLKEDTTDDDHRHRNGGDNDGDIVKNGVCGGRGSGDQRPSNINMIHLSASSTDIRSQSISHNGTDGDGLTPRSIRSGIGTTGGDDVSGTVDHQSRNGSSNGSTVPPGITGIRNHGNTCYMNAILQCLCHTDNLAKYFVLDHYKTDLSRRNKHNARKYGTRGEVTEQLAVVFKSLWSSQYKPEISNQFKTVVGKYETQYQGSNQQDAQEFLLWLLDKVHEDLNTATKKKYKKTGSNMGRPDEILAAEALANHLRCNNSFVHGLFQAQYRSSLTCPSCQKQSTTFDPFLCISIPIPQRQYRPVYVTVVYLNQKPRQVKLGICINVQATIGELRTLISTDTSIPQEQFILIELHEDNLGRTFKNADSISTIPESEGIYAIEVSPPKQDTREGEHVLLLFVNKLGVGTSAKRFAGPYSIMVHRECSYSKLQKVALRAMANLLKEGALERDLDSFMRFRVVDGIPGKCYLPDDVEHPLYMPTVDHALSGSHSNGRGPVHLKISIEWDQEFREMFFQTTDEIAEEHTTVAEMHNRQKFATATLTDCFNLYTQEERLGPQDPWLCPTCRRPQQGVKKISLWSLPNILVIHLKRFRQSGTQRTKLETLVEFPVQDLDMSPHIVHRSQMNHLHSNGNGVLGYWSPWKTHQRNLNGVDYNYDLYAICNHHGSMQSGHYTAYCKNPADGLWYHFDDTAVRKVDESQIITPSAYILFYERRSLSPGCSSSESSSCGSSDHWAYHMPRVYCLGTKASKSHDDLCDLDYQSGSASRVKDRSFLRGTRKYSSMVHLGSATKRGATKETAVDVAHQNGHHLDNDESHNSSSLGRVMPESTV